MVTPPRRPCRPATAHPGAAHTNLFRLVAETRTQDGNGTSHYDSDRGGGGLGISRAFAYELVDRGEIPVVRFGRRVVVPGKALETLLEVSRPTSVTGC
ncbi:MAG: helix-turn-helix domain-containing protein [Acidimicrobiia bacterium]